MGAGPSSQAGGGMNRMMVMMPLMLMSGKMDYNDQSLLTKLRLGYFAEQILLLAGASRSPSVIHPTVRPSHYPL